MTKRVSIKIFSLSCLVSLCAHTILLSNSVDGRPPGNSPASAEHIWSITENEEDSGGKNLRNTLMKRSSYEASIQKDADSADAASEWESGWDVDLEENSHDIETFFPLSEEESGTCETETICIPEDTQDPEETSQPEKGSSAHFFLLDDEEDETPVSLKAVRFPEDSESSAFADKPDADWPNDDPAPRKTGDISGAKLHGSSVHTQEKKKKARIIFEDLLDSAVENESPSEKDNGKTLGKKRVAVSPYTPEEEVKKRPTASKQVLSSKKGPHLKPKGAKPKEGLFGPFLPEGAQAKQSQPQEEQTLRRSDREHQYPEGIIAQVVDEGEPVPGESGQLKTPPKTILINFNNVSVIEYIRFISRITNKNFIFDESDLQFNVTIISEEPTTLENVMTALIQELRIHGLMLIEEGNNYIIHQNDKVKGITRVNTNGAPREIPKESELVTQVFSLNTLAPNQAENVLRPLLSSNAIISAQNETRHVIITDLVSNIQKVEQLLKSIDAPNSGKVLGQYVVRNAFMDNLIELAQQIMQPIAQGQDLKFVPHPAAKSIFIVSSPFIVERTISVLQHLDNFQGTTRIYDLEDLKFEQITPGATPPGLAPSVTPPRAVQPEGAITPTPERPDVPGIPEFREDREAPVDTPSGKWEITPEGYRIFRPAFPPGSTFAPEELPQGEWQLNPEGYWYFNPQGTRSPFGRIPDAPEALPGEAPRGRWVLDPQGSWIFQLSPAEELKPQRLMRKPVVEEELPLGHIERTKFYIHKLQYRQGQDIVQAMEGIAISLAGQGSANLELISTIQSVQWLEASNSLIITGTEASIAKVNELIEEIDQPQRQVFIEMLILETTIDDSLTYGVSWGTKSGGGNTATAQAFVGGASPLVSALASSGIDDGEVLTPSAANVIGQIGYNLGIIGQRLTHNGTQFASLGALVQAVHTRGDTNIIINPKIIAEDNKTAEIFVGVNSPFLSNSIANDEGSVITTNVEFRDTGTTLRVTPLIGDGDIITLEIEQEVSREAGEPVTGGGTPETNLTPTTSINRTTTTIHVPDKHFVVLSGMIQEQDFNNNNQFPCLGGIPILGAAFKVNDTEHLKRNLMVFIRPEIIDTSLEYRDLTRRQQQMFKQKNRMKKNWKYEVDEALDFMNIKPPCCDECD